MKPDPLATYERALRLANQAMWTVDLQYRRLQTVEPEDETFILRKWSDFHFLVVALTRLRRAATLATKVPQICETVRSALKDFDVALPHLKKMRDVAEHIDDYAVDGGKDKSISRRSLEVSVSDGQKWEWLGFEMDTRAAIATSVQLFAALQNCKSLFKNKPNQDL